MELPPTNTIVHRVEYDEDAVKKMENLAKVLAMKVTTGSFTERGQAARELDLMVRQATGISKAKYVAEYVKILLEGGEPVLLAGWHRGVYEIWEKEFAQYKPVWYTGSETPAQKEQAKQDFISGKSNLMIISLRSGVGLDGLQKRCKIVVLGELDWSPAVHEQVIGRVRRDGSEDQVTAIYLVSDSGSDPLMIELLGLKASQAKGIVDPLSGVEMVHSDDSRIKLLAERFLAK
jgi:SNF2 family DNA or RNA helicase